MKFLNDKAWEMGQKNMKSLWLTGIKEMEENKLNYLLQENILSSLQLF